MTSHYAKEAERLQKDDTLNKALANLRLEALADLVGTDANDTSAIIRAQERVKLIDEFRAQLARMVMAQKPANSKGTFA